jgi:dipeptidase E
MSRHIVACGGGGWSSDHGHGPGPLERYILGLAPAEAPRVCLLPTASGDSDWLVARFYEAFAQIPCRPSHLPLFRSHPDGLEEYLLSQDVIYVGGGSSANLMAVWQVHGLGAILRRAWERGVVLSGVSAGAICWFASGLTNSLGPGFSPVAGLGLLEGGFCPHADSDPGRLVALRELIEAGLMPATMAVDDGAAVHIEHGAPPRLLVAEPGSRGRLLGPGGTDDPIRPLSLAA